MEVAMRLIDAVRCKWGELCWNHSCFTTMTRRHSLRFECPNFYQEKATVCCYSMQNVLSALFSYLSWKTWACVWFQLTGLANGCMYPYLFGSDWVSSFLIPSRGFLTFSDFSYIFFLFTAVRYWIHQKLLCCVHMISPVHFHPQGWRYEILFRQDPTWSGPFYIFFENWSSNWVHFVIFVQ